MENLRAMRQFTPDHSFSRLRDLCFGGCFLILLASAGVSQKNNVCCELSSRTKPIWEVVLAPPGHPEGKCEWYSPGVYGTIAYTDSETIVAGFHFRSCPQTTKGSLGLRHVVDTVLKIDSQTGKLLDKREWQDLSTEEQNNLGEIDIIPTRDGRFLVKVGRFLKLFSSDFKELKSRELVENANGIVRENWTVQVSPDGKTGLFKRWNHGPAIDHWFSTDTLDDEAVETIPSEGRKSINSASSVYFTPPRGGGLGDSLAHVRLRGQQESHPLCPGCYGLPEDLLSDGTIFLATSPKASFALVSEQGEIIHRASRGDAMDRARHVVSASAARRFAFTFGHLQKRFMSWSAPTTVVVFDYKRMNEVLQLKFNQQLQNDTVVSDGALPMPALSPDGTRVAVLAGKVLQLFRVPD
jgi:hypothetical protein